MTLKKGLGLQEERASVMELGREEGGGGSMAEAWGQVERLVSGCWHGDSDSLLSSTCQVLC